MGLVAKRVADRRIVRLVRGFLTAGVLADGLIGPTDEGTPQGGPLSPLLSDPMLDVLDNVPSADGTSVRGAGAVRKTAQGSWSGAAIASCAAPVLGPALGRTRGPTTATSMCAVVGPANGS